MKDLENLDLVELNQNELRDIEGGHYGIGRDTWGEFVYWFCEQGMCGAYTSYYA